MLRCVYLPLVSFPRRPWERAVAPPQPSHLTQYACSRATHHQTSKHSAKPQCASLAPTETADVQFRTARTDAQDAFKRAPRPPAHGPRAAASFELAHLEEERPY